LSNWYSLA
jgi:hypothetical protein